MTFRKESRIRIAANGSLEIIDPSLDDIDLLRSIDPAFEILHAPLTGFGAPRVHATRQCDVELMADDLVSLSTHDLWSVHDKALDRLAAVDRGRPSGAVSLLDVKIELARRCLTSCDLCARSCCVDRWAGQRGLCELGVDALVAEAFIHIAEEPPINPSLVISLAGCGLRCRFCQQHQILHTTSIKIPKLEGSLWGNLDVSGARSLSFLGGNPDENLFSILSFLKSIPFDFSLPIVWNTHSFVPLKTISLLNGIVDVYLPDMKYGSESCGRSLSAIRDYPEVAFEAIRAMTAQNNPVILRVLVLPGHVRCCHLRALERLAELLPRDRLMISVRGQYAPDSTISQNDGDLARRPTRKEVETVTEAALALGFCVMA